MPLVLGAPAAGAALVAAAEWTLAACVTGLAALGIIEVTKDATAEDVIPIKPKSRTEEQIENDIALGETKSKSRLEEIAKTGALARSKEKCKSCPASTGIPTNEKRSFGNDINAEYQIYITKALSGPGWVQEWTYAAVSFDGFQLPYCLLQETKGAYDQFFIAENQIKKFWSGVQGIIMQAETQNAVVSATSPNKLAWYFMENLSFKYFDKLFKLRGYIMDTYHIPMGKLK